MHDFSLLICDEDSAYVNALSEYLCGRKKRISVVVHTQIDSFLNGTGHFDLALLGKTFLESYESQHPDYEIDRMLYLSENVGENLTSYDIFYKFQSMSNLNDTISKLRYENPLCGNSNQCTDFIGIYSPIYHDLRLPFALTLAHVMSKKQKVLFLDLEVFSVLPNLLNNVNFDKSFTDIVYLMESQGDDFQLNEHVVFYEDIAILPSIKNPKDLFLIQNETWMNLYRLITASGYGLVILFDQLFPYAITLFEEMSELVLLGKQEAFYGYTMKRCEEFFSEKELSEKLHLVELNMSAAQLRRDSYSLSSLMEGNLGSFVQNEFKRASAISNY
jgi:hypothetical protein